jgi:enoyl-CoA hydratase/carnithine racemase
VLFAMSDRVTCTILDGVADVRLNRPDKLNALDGAMFDALIDAGLALGEDRSVRAVVLSGEGRAFCAGLDLAAFDQGPAGDRQPPLPLGRRRGQLTSVAQQAVTVWTDLAVPVIAAVHGHAVGGGLQLALGADIRIVAPDARLAVLEIRWGLVPDMTATVTLPQLVGLDVAKDLTFTGRTVTGEEAVQMGLATRLSTAPRDDALVLAREVAAKSPAAIRAAKALFNRAGQPGRDEALLAEQRAQRRLVGSPDQIEALVAAMERRAPLFAG